MSRFQKLEMASAPELPIEHPERHTVGNLWLPLAALVMSLVCIVGSILVVVFSDQQPYKDWIPYSPNIEPSVLLAIIASVFNSALGLMLTGGISVVWWRCIAERASLSSLHYIWNKGRWDSFKGFYKAASSGSAVARVMVATVAIFISTVATNALLQAATTTVILESTDNELWQWEVPRKIPDGWVGSVDHTAPARLIASEAFEQIVQDWYSNNTIENTFTNTSGCDGQCYGTVTGAGIAANCTPSNITIDLSAPINAHAPLFSINFTRFDSDSGVPTLLMTVLYSSDVDSSCNATISIESCELQTGTVEYALALDFDTVTLDFTSQPTLKTRNASVGDSISRSDGMTAGPLAGLEWLGYYYFDSNATLNHDNVTDQYAFDNNGHLSNQYLDLNNEDQSHYEECGFQWQNATEDILNNFHQIMFRSAISTSNGSVTQTSLVTTKVAITVYYSSYTPLWIAVTIMVVAWLLTGSLLWGLWDFDRPVSMSPLETGMALSQVMSRPEIKDLDIIEADTLVDRVGSAKVQFVTESAQNGREVRPESDDRETSRKPESAPE